MARKTVGFVGLGRMGGRMARHVLKAGFTVHAFDVSPRALAASAAAGARPAGSAAEVASQSDVIMSVLPDAAAVEAALLGPAGITAGIRAGAVMAEMSTIAPSLTRRL
ncbi:MAG TPA: NAD(P)-binding domain-containing protein, partial [Candidatus Sulfotelmatobacter sp.]|nr:NAD(P)-binding domain-containing protein [Candidatus Sulfotelmatobacter sp.]